MHPCHRDVVEEESEERKFMRNYDDRTKRWWHTEENGINCPFNQISHIKLELMTWLRWINTIDYITDDITWCIWPLKKSVASDRDKISHGSSVWVIQIQCGCVSITEPTDPNHCYGRISSTNGECGNNAAAGQNNAAHFSSQLPL